MGIWTQVEALQRDTFVFPCGTTARISLPSGRAVTGEMSVFMFNLQASPRKEDALTGEDRGIQVLIAHGSNLDLI
jgi:hypothetical protein